jgi:pSer/pThr/pTyr-binding forkhead associated (FHA) protein
MTRDDQPSTPPPRKANAASSNQLVPVLVELKGDLHLVHAVSDRCVIGRSPECAVWLMDRLVSRRHAEIRTLASGQYQLVDLGSRYGTFLNREAIGRAELKVGDQVFLGATLLRFEERPTSDLRIRRHQNRLRCRLPVRATFGDEVVETVATDLSLGGLRLDWGRSPGLGTAMALEITFPGRPSPLRQAGHANHKSDQDGLGVRFYYTSEQQEHDLAEAFAQLYLSDPEAGD